MEIIKIITWLMHPYTNMSAVARELSRALIKYSDSEVKKKKISGSLLDHKVKSTYYNKFSEIELRELARIRTEFIKNLS